MKNEKQGRVILTALIVDAIIRTFREFVFSVCGVEIING